MKKGTSLFWSICFLVLLAVSCSPLPLTAVVATPGCDKGFSRLSLGQTITVVEANHPNRVRSVPHVSNGNVTGQISSGMTATVVDGPVCADGLVFWKIKSKKIPGGIGWTAEGDGKTHWLEQIHP